MSTDHKLRLRDPQSGSQGATYVKRVRLDFADLHEISAAMSTVGDVEIKSGHTSGTGTTILQLKELGLREFDDIGFR
jgi:hypothetical protein